MMAGLRVRNLRIYCYMETFQIDSIVAPNYCLSGGDRCRRPLRRFVARLHAGWEFER